MATEPVLEFDKISKTYQDPFPRRSIDAVHQVSFRVQPGEIFGLVGPNRAGKTTLIKILLTLCQPTSGKAFRFGKPITDRSTLMRVGYMHENQAFPRYWTAHGLLQYYGALGFLNESMVRERVPQLLKQVGLADRAHEPIRRFSKGMIQRLALAQALLGNPDLLVLDEPAEGLDLQGRQLVHDAVRQQKQAGKTVLLVSHQPSDVEQLCDRVGVVVGGSLVHLGTVAELLKGKSGTPRSMETVLRGFYEQTRS